MLFLRYVLFLIHIVCNISYNMNIAKMLESIYKKLFIIKNLKRDMEFRS